MRLRVEQASGDDGPCRGRRFAVTLRSPSIRGGLVRSLSQVPMGLLAAVGMLLSAVGCAGDFEDAPLSLERGDHGWLVSIEPDEVFDVGLVGNAIDPDGQWRLVEVDDEVVDMEGQEHEKLGQDLEDLTGDERATVTIFFFRGVAIGETSLVFELGDDGGDLLARTAFTIAVVDDACRVDDGLVANRCGDSAEEQPQGLTELNHGWLVALEPSDTIDVVLTGNPLYPDGAWQIVEHDAAVVSVGESAYRAADRAPGDWNRDSDASFLSRWTFSVTAVELGRSRVEVHFIAAGETKDVYSVTFEVAEDACAVASNQSTCRR